MITLLSQLPKCQDYQCEPLGPARCHLKQIFKYSYNVDENISKQFCFFDQNACIFYVFLPKPSQRNNYLSLSAKFLFGFSNEADWIQFISVFTLHTLKVIHSTRSVSIHYFMGKYCEILWTQASLFIYIGIIFVLDQLWALCVMLHQQCSYMFYMFFWQI